MCDIWVMARVSRLQRTLVDGLKVNGSSDRCKSYNYWSWRIT